MSILFSALAAAPLLALMAPLGGLMTRGALLPPGSTLVVRKAIVVQPETVSTPLTQADGPGCSLRHDESQVERTLPAGTQLVLDGIAYPQTGDAGIYAAVIKVKNYRDVTLYCATYPGEALSREGILRMVAGVMEPVRAHRSRIEEIVAAGGRLPAPAGESEASVFSFP